MHDELVDQAVIANGTTDRRQPKIWGIHANEMIFVKTLEVIVSDAPVIVGIWLT